MHPVAEKGFAESVEAYRRSRPSYPAAAVAWLVDALAVGAGSTIVDVGAGTGKATALLMASGASVVAVEPLASMRAVLQAELPDATVIDGMAEGLPLADASADAVVAAQSFHWFDLPRALPELARVLRPAGRLGVIWNELDTAVEWVARLDAIIAVPRRGSPHPSAALSANLGPWFGRRRRGFFKHAHAHDRASLLDRVRSMSFVAVLPAVERERILNSVTAVVDAYPELAGSHAFELPYVTHAFVARRRAG